MMGEPLVSIIVPVYNAEEYLKATLDCLCAQTLEPIEVILIDDGSTDSSGEICDRAAAEDRRFRVIHKANGGVSAARNLGIDQARGKYVGFVDSDDMPDGRMFAVLVADIEDNAADLAICDTMFISAADQNVKPDMDPIGPPRVIDEFSRRCADFVFGPEERKSYCIWDKLFRRDIIEEINLRYDQSLRIGEDTLFTLTYMFHCHRITVNDAKLYRHRIRQGSLMRSMIRDLCRQNIRKNRQLRAQAALAVNPGEAMKVVGRYDRMLLKQTFVTRCQDRRGFVDSVRALKHAPDAMVKFRGKGNSRQQRLMAWAIKWLPSTLGGSLIYAYSKRSQR